MLDTISIRVIAFKEGDVWVAQCLEFDIGAQAPNEVILRERLAAAVELEAEMSRQINGEAFAGIGRAPQKFFALWDEWTRRQSQWRQSGVVRVDHQNVALEMAMG
jgi:hypothetical protein